MLKRTLIFFNPYHLSVKNKQLVVRHKDDFFEKTIPVEDIGFVVLDHYGITLSLGLVEELNANNVALIFCNKRHHPSSMLLNLDGHHLQSEYFREQADASLPLKKQLWKQTVEAKIKNQAALLKKRGIEGDELSILSQKVRSGDPDNREGVAARIYWEKLMGKGFKREREGEPPNNLLNYGYIVLRAAVARALVGSGLLPTFGIHHKSRYNAYCLADDIMEPYRPFVDEVVVGIVEKYENIEALTKEMKAGLLEVLTADVQFGKMKRPLMVGLSATTASLARCFKGDAKIIQYPVLK